MSFYIKECNEQFQWDGSNHNGKAHENKQKWQLVDEVEEVPKMDTEEMQRIARETFPSEFMSRSTLNFEDHWELNLRIAYDDGFHNEFGSNAEARYQGIF